MKQPGQIALTPFPHTDLSGTKLRVTRRLAALYLANGTAWA